MGPKYCKCPAKREAEEDGTHSEGNRTRDYGISEAGFDCGGRGQGPKDVVPEYGNGKE